jgi:Protein of unknown function (DUF4232)
MRAGARFGWRMATVAAFGATAVLAVVLSRGAPINAALAAQPGPGTAAAEAAPRCAPAGLRISLGPIAHVTAMVTRYALDFTNVSGVPCTLAGYPQVAAYRGDDVQVGDFAARNASVAASRIVLAPGQTAHASLDASLSPAGCRPVRASGLRVVAPGQSAISYVRRSLTACAAGAAAGPDYLQVRAIQPGAGVKPE